jgi:hypothetical protein
MRSISFGRLCPALFLVLTCIAVASQDKPSQKADREFHPTIPKTWVDAEMAELEVPLADPAGSPKHVPAEYYYKIPVRPIYKQYPVYAPGHEPLGYIESLKQLDPVIIWGGEEKGANRPILKTEADWIRAGELVFEAPIAYGTLGSFEEYEPLYLRDPAWYKHVSPAITRDGVLPFYTYVVRKKGKVEIGMLACAMCHTRVMPDGGVIKGAQGNFTFDRAVAFDYRSMIKPEVARLGERILFAAPWIRPDPQARLSEMTVDEMADIHDAIPPGVVARHRSSPLYPIHVPNLIGVKDRRYLDATGLQQHRSIVDLMRYAQLNQGGDDLASFAGFIPADFPNFKNPPDPNTQARYSDEQLYALALYIYSLEPPPNPNKFDSVAARGEKVFQGAGCPMCHTPPLYTNNKLTPAQGFTPPPAHLKKYDILRVSLGTDPSLTLKTRRGTGYYKVPSLKGVWYRSMFEHNGSCATLEDWFDPGRTRDDYVPTGFKGHGVKTRAVKGHPFGLNLSAEDRKALIAFLKTL